jgi:hypothetical protein
MERGTAAEHRRTQRHRARPVIVFAFFGSRRWRSLAGSRVMRRFGFRLGGLGRGQRFSRRRLDQTSPPLGAGNFRARRVFVNLLLNGRAGTVPSRGDRERGMRLTTVVAAQLIGFVFVDRAGVGDFLGNAEFVQFVDDLTRLHFQLSRQFIDSNLTHIEAFRLTAFTTGRFATLRVREFRPQ